MNIRGSSLSLCLWLCACGAAPTHVATPVAPASDEPAPTLRLPTDARPVHQALVLSIDPRKERYSGAVDIEVLLDRPRKVLWLHGKGLHVTRASARPEGGAEVPATFGQADPTGLASLTLPSALPAGRAWLHLEYDAPFGQKLDGLHKITDGGVDYAFTQFEAITARSAFPCFDEPGFKIPWDVTLIVPEGMRAVANTHEIDRQIADGSVRVRYAKTLPLPSYLMAFAVGPLDIVEAADVPPNAARTRPLPLRAIAPKGRGKEAAYALSHAGAILATLEGYLGIAYPYDKLDLIAVPGKGGAMENPGAVTFSDRLLLFDEKQASLEQRRGYASVMAHELAHMWVGDLVTAAWWDDIWLNEAFATWLGTKATDTWDPKTDATMELLDGIESAIDNDAQVSARAIRQPITSIDDIANAFDGITYRKGGGVLSMFERWLGAETFRRGFHEYLVRHSHGNATADDFLNALSAAAGKDVKTPFHTFLDQPGVPFVEAELRCDGAPRLHLRQSRYLPLGSTGDTNKSWQIPICARYGSGKTTAETCTLLTAKEGDLPLGEACPAWVFPNSDAAGYFRFSLTEADLGKLRRNGFPSLSARERIAYGDSLRAAYDRGTLSMQTVIEAAAPLAEDPHRHVAAEPMRFLVEARDWLYDDPLRARVEAYARTLYGAQARSLGWQPAPGEDRQRTELRARIIGFLADTARDPGVRAQAKRLGLAFLGHGKDGLIHPEVVDANLAATALAVVGEDADRALWESVRAQLGKTSDAALRQKLLGALASTRDPALVAVARELAFDPSLRPTEVTTPLWAQLREPSLREAAWQWLKANFDKLFSVVSSHFGQLQLIMMGGVFCDEAHAEEIERFFTPERISKIEGGPRVLASTLESVRLCTARRKKQEPSARALFGAKH